jgi:hypothetical protein
MVEYKRYWGISPSSNLSIYNFFVATSWICCMCGYLPIIGLIKGIICCLPISLFFPTASLLIVVVNFPKNFIMFFYTLMKTGRIGINLKVFNFFNKKDYRIFMYHHRILVLHSFYLLFLCCSRNLLWFVWSNVLYIL